MAHITTQEFEIGGKTLKLEYGHFAEQANAAILATYGETTVHVTVVMSSRDTDLDYFPLQVEFAEKLYAELWDAYNRTGGAVQRKENIHRMAESNKAFAHFRW